jgi:mono/diheme cytochrome c family protein
MRGRATLLLVAALVAGPAGAAPPDRPPTPSEIEFVENKVRPVLVEHCAKCHGDKKQMAGLRLDDRARMLKGGESGPALVPGDPEASLLIKAVRHNGDLKMPPKTPLPAPAVEALTAWVKMGAPWPATKSAVAADAWKRHWAFQPVADPPLPTVKSPTWVRTPIDSFVLARLDAKGSTPSPEADRRTLIRRLSFGLLGLPPTPEDVAAFEADASTNAYERLVDRLLTSPHYGERWGRHWLDVARFADTKGYVFFQDASHPWAWTYRDYVIRSLNDDKPYDRSSSSSSPPTGSTSAVTVVR